MLFGIDVKRGGEWEQFGQAEHDSWEDAVSYFETNHQEQLKNISEFLGDEIEDVCVAREIEEYDTCECGGELMTTDDYAVFECVQCGRFSVIMPEYPPPSFFCQNEMLPGGNIPNGEDYWCLCEPEADTLTCVGCGGYAGFNTLIRPKLRITNE